MYMCKLDCHIASTCINREYVELDQPPWVYYGILSKGIHLIRNILSCTYILCWLIFEVHLHYVDTYGIYIMFIHIKFASFSQQPHLETDKIKEVENLNQPYYEDFVGRLHQNQSQEQTKVQRTAHPLCKLRYYSMLKFICCNTVLHVVFIYRSQ